MTPSALSVDADRFRAAMRLPATSVTVIATGTGAERNGLTASAVCSLSDNPPMILACVNRNSFVLPFVRRFGAFSANFLSSHQHELAQLFAGRTGIYGEARFRSADWTVLETGAPVLGSALASFDCTLETEHDSPTHAILIGRVRGIRHDEPRPGLIYAQGSFGQPQPLSAT